MASSNYSLDYKIAGIRLNCRNETGDVLFYVLLFITYDVNRLFQILILNIFKKIGIFNILHFLRRWQNMIY